MNASQAVYMSTYLVRETPYYYVNMTENEKAVSLWFDKDHVNNEITVEDDKAHLTIIEFKDKKGISLEFKWLPESTQDDRIEKDLVTIYKRYLPKTFVEVKYK